MEHTYRAFNKITDLKHALEINHYDYQAEGRRELTELILLVQMLHAGGYKGELRLLPMRWHYLRTLQQIASNPGAMLGTSIWHDTVQVRKDLWVSDDLVQRGEYLVGLYASPKNAKALAAANLRDVQKLTAVSNRGFLVDWKTLERMKLKNIQNTVKWLNMVKMVASQRVDFMLLSFQDEPNLQLIQVLPASKTPGLLSHQTSVGRAITLVPIPKLQVSLGSARNYIAHKDITHSDSAAIDAVNRGLKQFRAAGRIDRAFTESGFFNEKTRDWKIIN